MKPRFSPQFWGWLAALAAVALYLPTVGFDFVYDAVAQIQIDSFIHQPRHFWDVLSLRVLGMDVLDFNRPLNLFTLMIDSLLWGKNPAGYIFTNLLLHGATIFLLFRWLRIMTGSLWPALLAALAFAAHPLNVEPVVEPAYREDLLATLCMLAGLNAAAAFAPGEKGKTWGPALLVVVSFFLSAASKESGIAGPPVLAVFWFLFRRDNPKTRRAWWVLIAAVTAAVGTFLALRFALEPKVSMIFTGPPKPIAPTELDWLFVQSQIWCAEFLRIIWPAHLCADYGPYNIQGIDRTCAFLGMLSLGGILAAVSFGNRKVALASALFCAALLPVSNLVPIYRPMADRYFYMPLAGVALLIALALASVRHVMARRFAFAATLGVILALGIVTLRQQRIWKNETSLWCSVCEENPLSYTGWLGRGYASLEQGNYPEAYQHYKKARDLTEGKSPEPFAGMAFALDGLGKHKEAAEALAFATKLDSRYGSPDTLVDTLVLPCYLAQRLHLIALHAKLP